MNKVLTPPPSNLSQQDVLAQTKNVTLSLIIPCYNEEKTLREIIEKVRELKKSINLELIIVDDCSKDNSLQVANTLAEEYSEIKVLSHDVNKGKGAALRTGFINATGDFIGVQDADMEYNPEDYLLMLEPLIKNQDRKSVV